MQRDNWNSTWSATSSGRLVDEILEKYNCGASAGNFFPRMSSETLAGRLASLRGHVFSNANSQSVKWDQTNCEEGSKIDLSNNTPSMLTNSYAKCNQSGFTLDSTETSNPRDNAEDSVEVAWLSNTTTKEEKFELGTGLLSCASSNLVHSGENYVDVSCKFGVTPLTWSDNVNDNGNTLCSEDCERLNPNPVVVITPAMAELPLEERFDLTNSANGELSAAMLKDSSESCSLSSLCSCSENEILTDDEPSEDEIKPTVEEKSEKTNSRWKKIRGMIHWSPFVQNFKKKYPWVQLAGHQGCFKPGENGMILKKSTEKERECLAKLMKDILRPYIPEYRGEVNKGGERYLEMQDLLQEFDIPSVMDCKMGTRTYLEDELAKANSKPRKDLFQKMVEIDPNEPTEEEKREEGVTKPRYMRWREQLSSTASLGFRIEGIKKGDHKPNKDFKKTRTKEDVDNVFTEFIGNDDQIRKKYLRRLKAIRATLESSPFFRSHEVIGSSLLFVHDTCGRASVWMIDFGKTVTLKDDQWLNHRSPWQEGNHEDGYLWGLDNMVDIWAKR